MGKEGEIGVTRRQDLQN